MTKKAARWNEDQLAAYQKRVNRWQTFVPSSKLPEIPVLTEVAAPGKYHNIKSGGYDSKKEHKRAVELMALQRAGEIRKLTEQVKYELLPKQPGERAATYTADFRYEMKIGNDWVLVIEDVKSAITKSRKDYVLRRKLMLFRHGIKIKET